MVAALIAAAVLLCGGLILWRAMSAKQSVKKTQELFSGAFDAQITIKSGEAALTAALGRDKDGEVTLTVKEPSPLAGVVLKQKGGQIIASYGNMEVPLKLQGLPAGSAVEPLFSMLSGAAEMIGASVQEKNGRLILSGDCSGGAYTVTLDKKSGTVLQVNFPQAGFTCDFERFSKRME